VSVPARGRATGALASHPWLERPCTLGSGARPSPGRARAQLADAIGDRALGAALVETTYKYVRILLRSERIKTQSGERSLLKNLGSWLGKLTIARNRPVRHRDLDLKGILYEAYAQGKMIAVLPFVNKARARALVLVAAPPSRPSGVFLSPQLLVALLATLIT
jgi:hypothetical protein